MDMNAFNISATLNVFRLMARPNLCLPHATVSTFSQLPVPLNQAFGKYKNVDIRAVVLDKDNCFAYPHSNEVHKPYKVSRLFFNMSLQHLGPVWLRSMNVFPMLHMILNTSFHFQ